MCARLPGSHGRNGRVREWMRDIQAGEPMIMHCLNCDFVGNIEIEGKPPEFFKTPWQCPECGSQGSLKIGKKPFQPKDDATTAIDRVRSWLKIGAKPGQPKENQQ